MNMLNREEHKTMNGITKITITLAIMMAVMPAFAEDAPRFHINTVIDAVSDLKGYAGGSITAVTGEFGPPSAAWFNPGNAAEIDYIYIGDSKVVTFHVAKEGKMVNKAVSADRSAWESRTCRSYPDCPSAA